MSNHWRAVHLYAHDEQDLDLLVEAADSAVKRHAADPLDWFFIRYTEGGLHLRFRLGADAGDAFDTIAAELAAACSALAEARPDAPGHPWAHAGLDGLLHAPGSAVDAPYEPEIRRYGGLRGIEINERLFRTSSTLAAAITAKTPLLSRPRIAQAADLTLATLAAMVGADDPLPFLTKYAAGWRRDWQMSRDEALAPRDHAKVRARYAAHRDAAGGGPAAGNGPARIWTEALVRARTDFNEAHASGTLISPVTGAPTKTEGDLEQALASFAHSLIHMGNNRLGLWPPHEVAMIEHITGGREA